MSKTRDTGRHDPDEPKNDPPTPRGEDYLLVVGIDEYEYCPRLYNAVKDARDFIQLMVEKYQFSDNSEHLYTLFNEEATLKNIYHTLDRIQEHLKPGDNLLLYFSGHGEYKENIEEGFWIPVKGRADEMGTQISFSMLKKYLKKMPSLHILVIADSCYSGSFFEGGRSAIRVKEKLERIPSRWVLTAGRNEIVSDGKPGQNSPFASGLLGYLNRNEEPLVSIAEVTNFVKISVSDKTENDQIPRGEPIAGVGHEGGEFMFRLKGVAGPVLDDLSKVGAPETGRGGDEPAGPTVPPSPREEPTPDSLAGIQRALKRKLGAGAFEEAFELFYKVVKPNSRVEDDLILQEGQYNRLMGDKRKGMITDDYANRTLNRIQAALIDMAGDLEEGDLRDGLVKV